MSENTEEYKGTGPAVNACKILAVMHFDPDMYQADYRRCVYFSFFNKETEKELNKGNDLSSLSDADLNAVYIAYEGILKNVILPEVESRQQYYKKVLGEIEGLTGTNQIPPQ